MGVDVYLSGWGERLLYHEFISLSTPKNELTDPTAASNPLAKVLPVVLYGSLESGLGMNVSLIFGVPFHPAGLKLFLQSSARKGQLLRFCRRGILMI